MRGKAVKPTCMTVVAAFGVALLSAPAVCAERTEPVPPELQGISITENLKAQVPLDLEFTDEQGRTVKLSAYFQGKRPVILTLVYYRCPMLCGLLLNGLTDALKEMEWTAGQQFDIVTVSIDPLETPTLAKLKKQNYLKEYGRPGAAAGWHFLTGREPNIRKLADTVGFGYRYDEETKQYAHAAGIFVCTPEGRLARYLYGVMYDPQTLRLSLLEASEGKVGSTLDRVLLYCFHYDPSRGQYSLAAMNVMRAGGVLVVIILAAILFVFWRRERRRRRTAPPELQT